MLTLFITGVRFFRSLWSGLQEPDFRALFFFVIILLLSGAFFYTQVEHWSFLDSLYFCVTALTTVGSHLEPATVSGKIFTIIYIFFGLGAVGGFVAAIAHHSRDQHPHIPIRHKKKIRKK